MRLFGKSKISSNFFGTWGKKRQVARGLSSLERKKIHQPSCEHYCSEGCPSLSGWSRSLAPLKLRGACTAGHGDHTGFADRRLVSCTSPLCCFVAPQLFCAIVKWECFYKCFGDLEWLIWRIKPPYPLRIGFLGNLDDIRWHPLQDRHTWVSWVTNPILPLLWALED